MEHTQSHHSHHKRSHAKKIDASNATRIIAVVVFVLIIATMVFYLKSNNVDKQEPNIFIPVRHSKTLDISEPTENIAGAIDENAKPETIDLGMIDDNLSKTDSNLETIDKLENI